jgi:hypothetical protein
MFEVNSLQYKWLCEQVEGLKSTITSNLSDEDQDIE